METMNSLQRMKAARGPRHLVYGTIRPGEYRVVYATSAARAEEEAARMEARRYRQIQIVAPATIEADHAKVLQEAARVWQTTRDAETDLRQQLAAAAVTAIEAGMTESETARLAGVDRMTVRGWLGKR
jgi:DNA invertase Pin-like site-specific DNA recombinase